MGADAEEARRFLESDAGKPEIQAAQEKLRQLGVSGIPTCVHSGLQPASRRRASALADL